MSNHTAFALGRNHGGENVICFSSKDHGADASDDLAPTLRAGGHTDSHANNGVPPAIAYGFQPRIGRNGRGDMGDIVSALTAQAGETGKGDAAPCVAVLPFDTTQLTSPSNYSHPDYGARRHNGVLADMAVRRLIPIECERLQGFPDNWTLIPIAYRNKKAERRDLYRHATTTHQDPADFKWSADGPRYKALGNSMAVPCMRWIGRRIVRQFGLMRDLELI